MSDKLVKRVIEVVRRQCAYALTQCRLSNLLRDKELQSSSGTGAVFAETFHLIAIGKASLAMAAATCDLLGNKVISGLVIYPRNYHLNITLPENIECIESSHPVPSVDSFHAAKRLISFIENRTTARLLFLISGGTSALVELPIEGLTLDKIQALNQNLLSHSVPIETINTIRSRYSKIKGGGLRRWLSGCDVLQLSLSDVSADDPSVIGSGLLFPPNIKVDLDEIDHLLPKGVTAPVEKEELYGSVAHYLIGNSQQLADAVVAELSLALNAKGDEVEFSGALESCLDLIKQWLGSADRAFLVIHGEITLNLPNLHGKGGRCSHLALCVAQFLSKQSIDALFLALATDGADGNSEAAGAWINGSTWQHLEAKGLNPLLQLKTFNSYTALNAIGHSLKIEKGLSNVRDIYVVVKHPIL